ncbi:MAG: hypothetical protein IH614_07005, partial [Desulfuromonadales bacterium]|nr:hypothetical protein [Desulfuromonadales bacterium]
MDLKNRQSPLLLGFITFSLLLHLLLLFGLPERDLFPDPTRREPVVVEVRPPQPPVARPRELDLPTAPELESPRPRPAKRLGPADQLIEQETAPPGDAPEERRPDAPAPPSPPKPAQAAPPRT